MITLIDYEKITDFFLTANKKFTEQLNNGGNRGRYFFLNSNEKRKALVKDIGIRTIGTNIFKDASMMLKIPDITISLKDKIKRILKKG